MPRKKKPQAQEVTATEPTPIAEPLKQIMESRAAKAAIEPDRPMPEPEIQRDPRQERRRYPSIYTSVNNGFRLIQEPRRRYFLFEDDHKPTPEQKEKMQTAGFQYDPIEKLWWAPNTFQIREISDRLALEFDGKNERIGLGV